MTASPAQASRYSGPTLAFITPFLIYAGMIAFPLSPGVLFPLRCVIVLAVLVFLSRPYVSLRPSRPLASAAVGIFVFVIWVAPDLLFHYRHHWLFENSITGHAASSLSPALRGNVLFLAVRVLSSVALVPVLEELFWRGWLMRWWIDRNSSWRYVLVLIRPPLSGSWLSYLLRSMALTGKWAYWQESLITFG
jgi:uncharacterized protein